MTDDAPTFTIGGVESSRPQAQRMSCLIWGQAGVGKTTLAATMPGKKALINFDPDGRFLWSYLDRNPDLA